MDLDGKIQKQTLSALSYSYKQIKRPWAQESDLIEPKLLSPVTPQLIFDTKLCQNDLDGLKRTVNFTHQISLSAVN